MVNIFCYNDAHKTVTAINYTSTWNTPTPDLSSPYCTQRCLPYLVWHITVHVVKLPVAQLAKILCSTKFFVRFTTVSQWLLQYVRRIYSTSHPISPISILILSSQLNLSFTSVFKLNFADFLISTVHEDFSLIKSQTMCSQVFENSPTE